MRTALFFLSLLVMGAQSSATDRAAWLTDGANAFIDRLALGRFNDRQEQQFRAALEKAR